MAKKDNEDLKKYKEMLAVSHRRWERVEKDKLEEHLRYYRNDQWHLGDDSISPYSDQVTDNIIFSNIRTILPSINFRRPKIFVKAKKKPYTREDGAIFDTMSAAVLLEILLNWYYKELEIKRTVDKIIVDALIGFRGIAFIGYNVETEIVDDVNEIIKSDSPYVLRVAPEDFRFDPSCKDANLTDARWIAVKWVGTLKEAKKKYKHTNNLKANLVVDTEFSGKGKGTTASRPEERFEGSETWDRIEVWDVWDKVEKKVVSIAEGHDKFLDNKDWPIDYDGGFPIEILYFNENPSEPTPISDVEIYIDGQKELNRLRSLQLDHVRRISQRKYEIRKDSMTVEAKQHLQFGGDGTIIETDTPGSIQPIPDATISQDIWIVARDLKNALREESGVSAFEKGGAEKFDTATEPALIQQATNMRRDERVSMLENHITRIIRKVASILQQTLRGGDFALSQEELELASEFVPGKVMRVTGNKGDVLLPWMSASMEDIQGEYDFELQIGSTRPVDTESRKRDAMTLYQIEAENPLINREISLRKLYEAFDVQDVDERMRPMEEVTQEQQAQQQAAMEAQMAEPQMKVQADLQKTQMKTQTSMAQAELNSKTTLLKAALQEEGKRSKGKE